jgi:hypothetical protein
MSENRDQVLVAAKAAAVLGVLGALAALALSGGHAALSVAVGAVFAVANLVALRWIVRSTILAPETDGSTADHVAVGRRGGVAWGVFAILKIFVLFGGIWILLTKGVVDPIPLAAGYGVLVLGIAVSTIFTR